LRLATLETIADIELLPVDAAAALTWARMRVELAESGRRANVDNLWIAATAASRGLPVVTQDSDFDAMEGLAGLVVIRV
jgi:predicted nucleic acid-binding protein